MESHIPHRNRLWLYALTALVLIFLVLPTLVVIPMSFTSANSLAFPPPGWSLRWYENFFGQEKWLSATWVSLRMAFATMVISTAIGTAAAYALHVGRFAGQNPIRGVLIAPLMIPAILLAIGLFFVFARLGLLNTLTGLVLANTLVTLPFVIITMSAGLKSYDMAQEMVARSLGANRLTAFLTVTLPQLKLSLAASALLSFIIAFDEVVLSVFISGGDTATLTKVMFTTLRDDVDPTIAAVSTLLILIATLPPVLVQILSHSKEPKA
ncbi:ABC transporter permease [Paracoccus aminophilus]|uniref:Spermidine/putrescine transport system, permease protein n=1 Tax=Paracoccus aminophilus JCM 7686 TaxID=1367847 RepID=S5YE72_PARAH|nr:ABC transporter permease [Paracoccus aminophilus]AGT09783.1 spermidine/putrescine transport system, permease protein [Paracoccus aminophilus JCM 7686]